MIWKKYVMLSIYIIAIISWFSVFFAGDYANVMVMCTMVIVIVGGMLNLVLTPISKESTSPNETVVIPPTSPPMPPVEIKRIDMAKINLEKLKAEVKQLEEEKIQAEEPIEEPEPIRTELPTPQGMVPPQGEPIPHGTVPAQTANSTNTICPFCKFVTSKPHYLRLHIAAKHQAEFDSRMC